MRSGLPRFLLAALIGIFLFFLSFWYAGHLLAPMEREGAPVTVDIPSRATAAVVAQRLKSAGLIRSTFAFTLVARGLGESKDMKAGEYLIPPTLGVIQIIEKLVSGQAEAQWVVVPEGRTLGQIARELEDKKLVLKGEFLRAAAVPPDHYGIKLGVKRRSVEGYLMPDTYKFPVKVSEREILKRMVGNWKHKVWDPDQALFAKNDLPPDKIIVIASMIEREAKVSKDRALISSVVRNRLQRKMPLQIDATVLFALHSQKHVVTLKDLKVKSPYNTYRVKGLPPGPICNPGRASIDAALKPAATDYLYYVARPDGTHIFTRTAQEHQRAVVEAKRLREQASAGTVVPQP